MQNEFRLDDLLTRDVVPQWFEGVAIVQLVCRQLRAEGRETSFPNPGGILIMPGGSIKIAGGSDGNPVQAAAHVLGLMLGNDVPVRLRLAVSQATATDSGFKTPTEFSEALAYFERPNPESIIEAFRQRALMAMPREIAPPVRIAAAAAIEKQTAATPPAPRRAIGRFAVVLTASVMFACALIWTVGHRLPDPLTPKVATSESSEHNLRTVSPIAQGTTGPTMPQRGVNVVASPTNRRAASPESAARSVVAAPPQFEVIATTLSYRYPTSLVPEAVGDAPAGTLLEAVPFSDVRNRAAKIPDRIYSRADPQVTVPVAVYRRLPSDPSAGSAARGTTLELTIAASGLVERVRMLTAPRNVHEFMLLSAVKAWRFEPARIDGHPVRFRQLMTLTAISK